MKQKTEWVASIATPEGGRAIMDLFRDVDGMFRWYERNSGKAVDVSGLTEYAAAWRAREYMDAFVAESEHDLREFKSGEKLRL